MQLLLCIANVIYCMLCTNFPIDQAAVTVRLLIVSIRTSLEAYPMKPLTTAYGCGSPDECKMQTLDEKQY